MRDYDRSRGALANVSLTSLVCASFLMALHTCALGIYVAEATRQPAFDSDEAVVPQSVWRVVGTGVAPTPAGHHHNSLPSITSATVSQRPAAGDPIAHRRDGDDNGLAKAAISEPESKIDWSNRMIGKPISIHTFGDREVLLATRGSFVSNFAITTSLHMPPGSSTGLVRIVAIDVGTADKYLTHLGDDFFAQAPIQDASAMYAFLERALIAAKPGPVDEQDEPNSDGNAVPCGLWTVIEDSSQTPMLHIQAIMTYDHEWLKPLRLVLDVPRIQEGSPEDKCTLEIQSLREGFEARQAEVESQMRTAVDEMKTLLMRIYDSAKDRRAEVEELRSAVDILRLQVNNIITIRGYTIPMDATSLTNQLGSSTYEYTALYNPSTRGHKCDLGGTRSGIRCQGTVTSAPSWYPAYNDNGVSRESLRYDRLSQILPPNMTQEELQSLSLCKNLTHLTIHNSPDITDLSPLRTLVALKKLDFTGCSGLTEVAVLNSLPNLEEVNLSNSGVKNKHFLTNPRLKVVGAG